MAEGEPGGEGWSASDVWRNATRARRRWRQENRPGERVYVHQVKVTEQQEAVLVTRAAEAGMTVARWLAEAGAATEVGVTREERREWLTELMGIERLVAGIANNVNQIAAGVNATGETDRDLRAVADHCDRLLDRTGSAIETVARW